MFKIFGIGVAVGIVLSIIQNTFKIDSELFLSYYWKLAILFLLMVVAINAIYFIFKAKKINKIIPLLSECKYQEYIDKMEDILKKAKGKYLRNTIKVNLSAGYIGKREYEKALNILNSVNEKSLKSEQFRFVYWTNICCATFRLGDYDKFQKIYNSKWSLLEEYRNNKNYVEPIAQLEVANDIAKGDFEGAEKLLQELRAKNTDLKLQQDYDELEKIIAQNRSKNQYGLGRECKTSSTICAWRTA